VTSTAGDANLMNVPPTSMDALRVRQVGAWLIWWSAVLALMYFLSVILRDLMLASG
jgi:hypothetical protein